jgi:preprotein translocase subunit YajC
MDFILRAQDAPASPEQAPPGGLMSMLIPMGVIFLIFWLLVIRPQSKAQGELKKKIGSMKRGDTVRTRGGLIGQVAKVEETEVVLRIDLDGKIRRNGHGTVLPVGILLRKLF